MHRTLLPLLTLLPLSTLLAQDKPAPAGDKLQLQVHLAKGPATWFKSSILSAQNIDMGAQQMEMKTDVTWIVSAAVTEVPAEGLPVVEFEIGAVRGSMTLPMMGDVNFDSTESAGGDDIAAGFSSLVGTKFKATVSPSGKVTITDDMEQKLADAREKAGGMASQMLMGVLNVGTLQHLVDGVFCTLPEQAIAVGESWDHADKSGAGRAPVTTKMKLTLAKVSGDTAEFTGAGTIEMTADAGADAKPDESEEASMARQMMKDMKIENGKLSSKMVWSRKDSMVVNSSQDMSMSMSMPGPMGGDMKIQQTQKMQVERTTADAAKAKVKAAAPADKK